MNLIYIFIPTHTIKRSFKERHVISARFARSNTNKVATQVLDYAASHPGGEIAKNDFGCPIPSLSASLTVGRLGSVMLDDVFLINELGSFARERIPERVAYAKGKYLI